MKCLQCKKEFVPKVLHQKYCTEKCKLKYRNEKAAKRREELKKNRKKQICEWCKNPFLSTTGGSKFCSTNCRNLAADEKRSLRQKPIDPFYLSRHSTIKEGEYEKKQ